MDDVFFYFKFLLFLSRDQPVCSAQDHPKVVGRVPNGETVLGSSSCCEVSADPPGHKASERRNTDWFSKSLPLLEAVGSSQDPARTDQYSPTQEPLPRRPPVLDKDGSLPRMRGDVREESSFNAKLRMLVLSQATGGWERKGQRREMRSVVPRSSP